jgi:hypothetical protein
MKTAIVLTILTVFMTTITAFELRHSEMDAKEKIGVQVIAALQRSSAYEFSALFPTLADFHGLMLKNSELYGKNLTAATREFEKEFGDVLYPKFTGAFQRILEEGRSAGIDWRTIELVSVEVPEDVATDFASVPMTITFAAGKKIYHLKVEKALMFDGEWKLSQYIALEN